MTETEIMEPPPWNSLPYVVLTKIYEHLDFKDRMNASNSCKSWRSMLFQRKFFHTLRISLGKDVDNVSDDFIYRLPAITTDLTLVFNMNNNYHLQKMGEILHALELSNTLQSLTLQPTQSLMSNPPQRSCNNNKTVVNKNFVRPLMVLFSTREIPLKKFDIGCIESLAENGDLFFKYATPSVTGNLEKLRLASIKEDPCSLNNFPDYKIDFFTQFQSLQTLSIDFDYLCDIHLKAIESLSLKSLAIHVHNLSTKSKNNLITEEGWLSFKTNCPNTEVNMTVLRVSRLYSDCNQIFQCDIPLAHLKILFCKNIKIQVLDLLPAYYENTLKSFVLVDSVSDTVENYRSIDIFGSSNVNPLILMAWRCKHLYKLVIHGYELDPINLVGISRLRGSDLKVFEVSEKDISMVSPITPCNSFVKQVSEALKRKWYPLESYLPNKSICNGNDIEKEYITHLIRADFDN